MKKSCIRYAVHKSGTEMFGSLCTYESEAKDLLEDLKKNIINMSDEEKSRFHVVQLEVSWNED